MVAPSWSASATATMHCSWLIGVAGVGVKMKVPTTWPPPRTASSTCCVGKPDRAGGPPQRIEAHRAVRRDPGSFAGGLLPHEAAVLQAQELPELARHGNQNEVRVLAPGNALAQVVQASDLVSAGGGGQSVAPATGGQLADQQTDDDEQHLRGDVRRPADPEGAVGTRQEKVERRRRHDGRGEGADPAPGRCDGHRDDDQHEGVIGAVKVVAAGNEEEGDGDRRRDGHRPLEGRTAEQHRPGQRRSTCSPVTCLLRLIPRTGLRRRG